MHQNTEQSIVDMNQAISDVGALLMNQTTCEVLIEGVWYPTLVVDVRSYSNDPARAKIGLLDPGKYYYDGKRFHLHPGLPSKPFGYPDLVLYGRELVSR